MKQIILASGSPRRKQLLSLLGLEFKTVASNISEKLNPRFKPRRQTEFLSLQKARHVSEIYPDAVIIAADTLVAIGDDILGKPKDSLDAQRMLKRLSGNMHLNYTGFTVCHGKSKKEVTDSVQTKVTFKKLSQKEITEYIKRAKPFDKAGAYALQDLGCVFIERIDGDYHAALGLPLFALCRQLRKFGITVL
jgi:septum formation protein